MSERQGQGAIGIAIYRNKKMIGQFARGLGECTNNQAEYEAVIHGLLLCWAADLTDPVVYTDSMVVSKQINGEWQCNTPALKPLLLTIREIQEEFRFRVIQRPRKELWEPDALCNLFLDKLEQARKESGQPEIKLNWLGKVTRQYARG